MQEDIESLGPNKAQRYIGHWAVNNYRVAFYRATLGGLYITVKDTEEKEILCWPSIYHKAIIMCQLNYLAHEILNNNIENVKKVTFKQYFRSKYDTHGNNFDIKLLWEDMNKWQAETFDGKLDEWEGKYKYIPEMNWDEAAKLYAEYAKLEVDAFMTETKKKTDEPKISKAEFQSKISPRRQYEEEANEPEEEEDEDFDDFLDEVDEDFDGMEDDF
jgi:hypothetical protein